MASPYPTHNPATIHVVLRHPERSLAKRRTASRVIPCRGTATASAGALGVAEPMEWEKDRDGMDGCRVNLFDCALTGSA